MFAGLETITQTARSCWSVAVQTRRQPDSCCDVLSPLGGKILYYFIWSDTKNWSSKTTICFAAYNGSPAPEPEEWSAQQVRRPRSPEHGACTFRLHSLLQHQRTCLVSLGQHGYRCLAISKRMLQYIAIN